MNCLLKPPEQQALLFRYLAGDLTGETLCSWQRHVASCPDCQHLVQSQENLEAILSSWQPPAISADFDQKLWARIELDRQHTQPWWLRYLSLDWGWRLAVPAALTACLILGFFVLSPAPEVMQAEDIEQVERMLDDLEALQALHPQPEDPRIQDSL
ncbi:MAG: hypothetical protein K7J46_14775 [Bryobacter sp.]|nr:hypothetical protein [Bryobacter sp. CoA8 C33]